MISERGKKMDQNTFFNERENISDEDLLRKNRRNNIIAFIVCTLLAFTLWLMIRNANDTGSDPELPPVNDQTTVQAQ